jgi:hypothetical protein
MTPTEKEALVVMLDAYSKQIITLIGRDPNVQYWDEQKAQKRVDEAVTAFLAAP